MPTSHVAFRVDASVTIGTGHVMRCLTLANQLRDMGVQTRFICREHEGHMAKQILACDHEVRLLPLQLKDTAARESTDAGTYASWLGGDYLLDVKQTGQMLADVSPSWLVVDHYAIDAKWESLIRREFPDIRIMVIDGLANRAHDCDLLLDQTYSADGRARWQNLLPVSCKLMQGPQFALLRPEFDRAKSERTGNVSINRIFVSFGGVDPPNATEAVIEAIAASDARHAAVDVVVGELNPHLRRLRDKCQTIANVTLHVQASNVADLMANADLAICAGGTMLLELCHMHLPAIVISIAENQVAQAAALHSAGAIIYAGPYGQTTRGVLAESLNEIFRSPETLKDMQAEMKNLMDWPQDRVADVLRSTT